MKSIKKLNEVKPGDTLYCIAYGFNGKEVSIVEVTDKEVIANGPDCERGVYSREAIVIKEKVPNSPEPAGKYVIDQYYRGDECATHSYGIYTTFLEAIEKACEEAHDRYNIYAEEAKKYNDKKLSAMESMSDLVSQLFKYAEGK